MQKLHLKQALTQRLTPQQIQLIKLLQVPAVEIKGRIEQELAANPILEQTSEDPLPQDQEALTQIENVKLENSLDEGFYKPWHQRRSNQVQNQQDKPEVAIPTKQSLHEQLLEQLYLLPLSLQQQQIGEYLLGSLESDGYIRRDLEAIVNDLACTQYVATDVQEVAAVLQIIQGLDSSGIGARNLQECLLIQLQKKKDSPVQQLAIQILTREFEALSKKHYNKLAKKLGVEDLQMLREAIALIGKLNPKPGDKDEAAEQSQPLYPDFVVTKQDGELHVALSTYHTPRLGINKQYTTMLNGYQQLNKKDQGLREATVFVKQKLAAAQGFITTIKQRQQTLLQTMQAIVKLQYDFFIEEEEQKLKPMILKDVAKEVSLDVSTVSRVVTNKSVQTDLGIYPLKLFFTEAISTTSGEEVSNLAVKQAIAVLIQEEDKRKPYADDKLAQILQEQGYQVARRTVAKYREQLRIPLSRLRKEL